MLPMISSAALALAASPLPAASLPAPSPPPADELRRRVLGYDLRLHGTSAELQEYALVLEQAWPQFEALFKAAPDIDGDEPIRVYLAPDKERWERYVRQDGHEVPGGVDYVYFDPEANAVYAYRQPGEYQTRAFLLHGLCQQFHCKSKPKNRDLVRTWLVMGVADHMSLHTWDGETLALGALPTVGSHDPLAVAREALDPERFDPDQLYDTGITDPAVCFAIVRYLVTDASKSQQKRFYKLALGYNGSKLEPRTYATSLGKPRKLVDQLLDFLDRHQQPMKAETGEWEDRGPDLRGRSLGGRSYAVLKRPAERFEVVVHAGERGAVGGVAFGAPGTQDSILLEVYPDELLLRGRDAGGREVLEPHPLKLGEGEGARVVLELRREGVEVKVDDRSLGTFLVSEPRVGLFVEDGACRFGEPSWE